MYDSLIHTNFTILCLEFRDVFIYEIKDLRFQHRPSSIKIFNEIPIRVLRQDNKITQPLYLIEYEIHNASFKNLNDNILVTTDKNTSRPHLKK